MVYLLLNYSLKNIKVKNTRTKVFMVDLEFPGSTSQEKHEGY